MGAKKAKEEAKKAKAEEDEKAKEEEEEKEEEEKEEEEGLEPLKTQNLVFLLQQEKKFCVVLVCLIVSLSKKKGRRRDKCKKVHLALYFGTFLFFYTRVKKIIKTYS